MAWDGIKRNQSWTKGTYVSIPMSENDSPVNTVFELQRNAIERTHDVLERSVELQQDANGRVIDSV
jgi:hypothetical protein